MLSVRRNHRELINWHVGQPFLTKPQIVRYKDEPLEVYADGDELEFLITESFDFDSSGRTFTYYGAQAQMIIGYLCGRFSA